MSTAEVGRLTAAGLITRAANDVDTVSRSLNQSLSSLASSLTFLLGSRAMMPVTNWVMGLSGISAAPPGMVLMSLVLRRSQR